MTDHRFTCHTIESAPAAARKLMEGVSKHLGYLPAGIGMWAESPQLLDGFLRLNGLFESTTLDPLAREVLVMTMATRNGCHLCVAMHTERLTGLGADPELITALRAVRPVADPRLDAVRLFVLDLLATTGAVSPESLDAFLAQGFTRQNALEVVLGIGVYTMSTFANRLIDAPVDEQLAPYAWAEHVA